PDLISRIKEAQKEDNEIWTIVENLDEIPPVQAGSWNKYLTLITL
nr:hypothetical protein [Tanacetum cinerariifolium]